MDVDSGLAFDIKFLYTFLLHQTIWENQNLFLIPIEIEIAII